MSTTFTLNDPQNLGGSYVDTNMLHYAQVAWGEWAKVIVVPTVQIIINVTNTLGSAAAGSISNGVLSIAINPTEYWVKYIFQGSNYQPGDNLGGKDAPDYVFLHEMGHALGINRGDMGLTANAAFYYGAHAEAGFNGQPIPITPDGYEGHLSHTIGDGLSNDIMSGIAPNRSFTQTISAVDVGIIWDEGKYLPVGVNPTPAPAINHELVDLYTAEFNRAPDASGVVYWNHQLDAGMTLAQIAASFSVQPEFAQTYPEGTPNSSFISKVYQNAFGHAADPAGLTYWTKELDLGHITRANAVLALIEGAQGPDLTVLETKATTYLSDHATEINLVGQAPVDPTH